MEKRASELLFHDVCMGQFVNQLYNILISNTTNKNWPNLFFFPLLENEHALRCYSDSVTHAHFFDNSYGHRNQAEECNDQKPQLQAKVIKVLFPVIQREDDQRGAEEQLHVAHEVPSLTEAGNTSSQVGYVQ